MNLRTSTFSKREFEKFLVSLIKLSGANWNEYSSQAVSSTEWIFKSDSKAEENQMKEEEKMPETENTSENTGDKDSDSITLTSKSSLGHRHLNLALEFYLK